MIRVSVTVLDKSSKIGHNNSNPSTECFFWLLAVEWKDKLVVTKCDQIQLSKQQRWVIFL